ncbi:MAG: Mur ligase family protein, partial [Chitinophagales bacterium]|nr:Mur ligase family protein [Chitinophagales bacterium]
PLIIIEGDEYLASVIQPESKFLFYKPHIAVITGIAWDHINVFPTFEEYSRQFKKFISTIENNGTLIWCSEDEQLTQISSQFRKDLKTLPYACPQYFVEDGKTFVTIGEKKIELKLIGRHNMLNMAASYLVCKELGVEEETFAEALQSFEGAAGRLQKLFESEDYVVFKDFAHAPSKVKATLEALRTQYPERRLIAVLELHTYSSLNEKFLPEYRNTLKPADRAIIFLDKHAFEIKKMPMLREDYIINAFNLRDITFCYEANKLLEEISKEKSKDACMVLMSSGNFGGLSIHEIFKNETFNVLK